jgi:CO/xanthine dehydrogenase Mo-binding subunit
VIHPETGAALPLEDLVGDGLVVEERYRPPSTAGLLREPSHYGRSDFESRRTFWGYTYSTQVAIVGVQVETGDVRVLELISANDVGAVLNRQAVEGQIYGGAMMGLGYALSEEFVVEGGVNLTDSLHKCRLPAADRTPGILPVVVEVPHPFGPRGAKGFAEGPSLATTPAILNAIYDAVGVRITALPADRGRVVKAAMANGRKGDSLSPEQPT